MKTITEQQKYAEVLKTFKDTYIADPSKRSVENGWCQYKDPKTGNKCAVGMYIPDEAYSKDFEEKNVREIFGKIKIYLPVDDVEFWTEMQYLHDMNIFDYDMQTVFLRFNGLVRTFCPKFSKELLIDSEG